MFCPRCGEERISQETSFCSKCGYLLTGTAELLEAGGTPLVPTTDRMVGASPRLRGIKLGMFMLLLTIVLAPIVGIISVFALNTEPWPVGVVIFLLGGGGLLRIVYALMFESKERTPLLPEEGWPKAGMVGAAAATDEQQLSGPGSKGELYPSSFIPPPSNRWLDTNDLEPTSVTDHTTKLLEKDS